MRMVSNLSNYRNELSEYGLTEETYEACLRDIDNKIDGLNDYDWIEIKDKYNLKCHQDVLRKASQTIFGGKFRKEWESRKQIITQEEFDIEEKIRELRKERAKLQTANLERNRLDRQEARKEMFYEYVGNVIKTLPLPDFKPLLEDYNYDINYVLSLADIHYGAKFYSSNNEYSPEIFKDRLEYLLDRTIQFVKEKKLNTLYVVSLGDTLQGILRVNDLRINDSSVVKATVEISRLIAMFLNNLSEYCNVKYYHSPSANHTQLRNLGTKANELADEDLEYVIGNYISDLCKSNDRITINLANDGDNYINISLSGNNILAGHGNMIKNLDTSIRDLSMLRNEHIDYLMLGHFHGGKSFTVNESGNLDTEVIICPSFIGSDPYSDSIMKGSKAACIINGFDTTYGHIETYKIILN